MQGILEIFERALNRTLEGGAIIRCSQSENGRLCIVKRDAIEQLVGDTLTSDILEKYIEQCENQNCSINKSSMVNQHIDSSDIFSEHYIFNQEGRIVVAGYFH